jgi:hypothetical protein
MPTLIEIVVGGAAFSTILTLHSAARTQWMAGSAGVRWYLMLVVPALTVCSALVVFHRAGSIWLLATITPVIQWGVVIMQHRLFVRLMGYPPRDVYQRFDVDRSAPDKIYMGVGFLLLTLLPFAVLELVEKLVAWTLF